MTRHMAGSHDKQGNHMTDMKHDMNKTKTRPNRDSQPHTHAYTDTHHAKVMKLKYLIVLN